MVDKTQIREPRIDSTFSTRSLGLETPFQPVLSSVQDELRWFGGDDGIRISGFLHERRHRVLRISDD